MRNARERGDDPKGNVVMGVSRKIYKNLIAVFLLSVLAVMAVTFGVFVGVPRQDGGGGG